MLQLVNASMLLAKLVPMKPLLCVVAQHAPALKASNPVGATGTQTTRYGLALSDPYLGYASRLETVDDWNCVQTAFLEHAVGAVTFALPMVRQQQNQLNDHRQLQAQLTQQSFWNTTTTTTRPTKKVKQQLFGCVITPEEQLTLAQAHSAAQEDPEQWEEIDLEDPSLATDAAVALNHFLWIHTGGWRNNTFG